MPELPPDVRTVETTDAEGNKVTKRIVRTVVNAADYPIRILPHDWDPGSKEEAEAKAGTREPTAGMRLQAWRDKNPGAKVVRWGVRDWNVGESTYVAITDDGQEHAI